jgi:hypothetical protein
MSRARSSSIDLGSQARSHPPALDNLGTGLAPLNLHEALTPEGLPVFYNPHGN